MKNYRFKIGENVKWGAGDVIHRGRVLSMNPQMVEVYPNTQPPAKASVFIPHKELTKDNDIVNKIQEIMKDETIETKATEEVQESTTVSEG